MRLTDIYKYLLIDLLLLLCVFFFIFESVETFLVQKPDGERIINEYKRTKSLGDERRRKMVNILTADMTEKNGSSLFKFMHLNALNAKTVKISFFYCSTSPPRQVKEKYARGIGA